MSRPYVICHMTMSLDGKVTGSCLARPDSRNGIEDYYQINRDFHADAYACGRVTMEESFLRGYQPDLTPFAAEKVERTDFVADHGAKFFAVAFDRRGRLGWNSSRIRDVDTGYDNAHIIEVLCEDVEDAYLAYLRSIGVSYIFGGQHELDLRVVLEKLDRYFNIRKLLLEGGSTLNGSFLRAGLIDALSVVILPCVGQPEDKSLFADCVPSGFQMLDVQEMKGSGCIWACYKRID